MLELKSTKLKMFLDVEGFVRLGLIHRWREVVRLCIDIVHWYQ